MATLGIDVTDVAIGGTVVVTSGRVLQNIARVDSDLIFTDATYDIGKSGATRPRDGFFSRNVAVGGTLTVGTFAPTSLDISGSTKLASGGAAAVLIGTSTANAKNTRGLSIQQGTADDEILSLKSSDVAHGITGTTETDTYATFSKLSATEGGLLMRGLSEGSVGVYFTGIATTENTAKSTSAVGPFGFQVNVKSGTGTANMGADSNLFVIRNGGTTRFIFDAEGSAHADVEFTTF